jgi:hypothetical protein
MGFRQSAQLGKPTWINLNQESWQLEDESHRIFLEKIYCRANVVYVFIHGFYYNLPKPIASGTSELAAHHSSWKKGAVSEAGVNLVHSLSDLVILLVDFKEVKLKVINGLEIGTGNRNFFNYRKRDVPAQTKKGMNKVIGVDQWMG